MTTFLTSISIGLAKIIGKLDLAFLVTERARDALQRHKMTGIPLEIAYLTDLTVQSHHLVPGFETDRPSKPHGPYLVGRMDARGGISLFEADGYASEADSWVGPNCPRRSEDLWIVAKDFPTVMDRARELAYRDYRDRRSS